MSYTPPAATAVDFSFARSASYTAPAADGLIYYGDPDASYLVEAIGALSALTGDVAWVVRETATLNAPYTLDYFINLYPVSTVDAAATPAPQVAWLLADSLVAQAAPTTQQTFNQSCAETLGLAEVWRYLPLLFATDSLVLAATPAEEILCLLQALDALALTGPVSTTASFQQALSEGLSVSDALRQALDLLVSDSLAATAPLAETIHRLLTTQDALALASPADTAALFTQVLSEELSLSDSLRLVIDLVLSDGLAVTAPATELVLRLLSAQDGLGLASPVTTSAIFTQALEAGVSAQDALGFLVLLLASDSLDTTSPLAETVQRLVAAVDALTLLSPTTQRLDAIALVADTLALETLLPWAFDEALVETLGAGAELSAVKHSFLAALDTAALVAETAAQALYQPAVAETLDLRTSLGYLHDLLVGETVGMGATPAETIDRLLAALERLGLGDTTQADRETFLLAATALSLEALSAWTIDLLAEETIEVVAAVQILRRVMAEALSQAALSSAASGTLNLFAFATTPVALTGATDNTARLQEYLSEGVTLLGTLTLPSGETYTAVVLNLATQAPYTYTNYPFNSFATVGDRQFGCKADGLYELVGDDDDGAAIEAHFKTGLLDFGSPALKNLSAGYLGYTADGELLLAVDVTAATGKQRVNYVLSETQDATAPARLKLGKGVKARYWQFTLANVAGSDFEIAALDVLPVVLSRRI